MTSGVEENGGEKARREDKKRRRGRKRRRDDERLFAEHFLWNSASRRMGLFTSTFLNEESCLPAWQLRVFLKKNLMDEIKEMSPSLSQFFFFLFLFLNQNIRDFCLRYPESGINEKKRKDIYGLFSLPAHPPNQRDVLSFFFILFFFS